MKLFATWEVEKSTPNCIPRLCSLTLTRLIVVKPLENDLQSVLIAVKMQNSKRVLRSNEIILPPNGLLDTELDLSFSLQYPHFLKRENNRLQVMLQRRKKYKNRTILGYKTLAIGQVNMAQVLQRSVDRELNLYADVKESTNIAAQVMMLSLSSQPVDHEENGRQKLPNSEADRSPEGELTDDDQEDHDFASSDDMSDSEPIADVGTRSRQRKPGRGQMRPFMARQRNLKQRFVALLKRFKVTEEALDSEEQDQDLGDQPNQQEIEELFDQLEEHSDSDSGPEIDNISVLSTPKPKLRPFFAGRGSSHDILEVPKDPHQMSDDSSRRNDSDSHVENLSDQSDTPKDFLPEPEILPTREEKERKQSSPHMRALSKEKGSPAKERKSSIKKEMKESHSSERKGSSGNVEPVNLETEPRIALLEQLNSVLSIADEKLPNYFVLVNTNEWQGQYIGTALQEQNQRVLSTFTVADVKAIISHLVSRIQKFCNTNSRAPSVVKVVVVGGDHYVNSVLIPYVEQFSTKSPDWQQYVKFVIIPTGSCCIGRYLSNIDSLYNSLFMDYVWKEAFDKSEPQRTVDNLEIANRIKKYINSTSITHYMPIAEAMLTYKDKHSNEESSQSFVPFINEVRIGPAESSLPASISVDMDDGQPMATASMVTSLSSSPPQSSYMEKAHDSHTPPNSPNVSAVSQIHGQVSGGSVASVGYPEYVDLQLDYWAVPSKQEPGDKGDRGQARKDNKVSLKSSFKTVQVSRLLHNGDATTSHLTLTVVTKEKKKQIMRIGKKSKSEVESKSQVVEGITRLICTSKSQSTPFKAYIDGAEWTGVKFFQLSSQWQTHIKQFPVAVSDETDG